MVLSAYDLRVRKRRYDSGTHCYGNEAPLPRVRCHRETAQGGASEGVVRGGLPHRGVEGKAGLRVAYRERNAATLG